MRWLLKTVIRFFAMSREFGIVLAWYYLVYPRLGGKKAVIARHCAIKQYLYKNYGEIVGRYRDAVDNGSDRLRGDVIWFCWLQGEENMPEMVRCCYEAVRINASGREVRLVTSDNYSSFVTVPDFIMKKLEQGKLSRTHFADYLRVLLLSQYGGLWIDATVFTTGKIDEDMRYSFYSVKMPPESIHYVSEYRWAVWLLGCSSEPGRRLFLCVEELFRAYIAEHDTFIDFFLFDYFIAMICDRLPQMRAIIDEVPLNNTGCYKLFHCMNDAYTDERWKEITDGTVFHKCSWKQDCSRLTASGQRTFYDYLMNKHKH